MENTATIKRCRPHPLYILSNLWKYLFILLIPVVRGLYYVLLNSFSLTEGFTLGVNLSRWLQGAWVDLLVFFAFLSLGVLLWATFTVEVSDDGLQIRRGIFRREVTFLPVSRYCCVSVVQPVRLWLFGAVYLRVDTAGGNFQNADLLVMLKKKDCQKILRMLQAPVPLAPLSPIRSYKPKSRYVFILAMITSNSFAGMVLISTFITQVGNILGQRFSEMIYGTFENVARTLAFGIPPTAFAIACVMSLGYLCAFVASLTRHANFHVMRRRNLLEVSAGLLTRRSYRIEVGKIGYLDIRRSLLTCILGVYSIFLSTVGYGKFKDDVSALIPCVRKRQLDYSLRLLLPEYHLSERTLRPHRIRSAFRYTWRTLGMMLAVLVCRLVLCYQFPDWQELILWVAFMANFSLIWLLIVKLIDLNTAGISFRDGCYTLRYSKGYSLHQVIIRPQRIVRIRRVQSIFQRRTGRCDVYIYSYSEGRQTHHVRDLKKDEVEKIFMRHGLENEPTA